MQLSICMNEKVLEIERDLAQESVTHDITAICDGTGGPVCVNACPIKFTNAFKSYC